MARENQPVDAIPGFPPLETEVEASPAERKLNMVREHCKARKHLIETVKDPAVERYDAGALRIINEVLIIVGEGDADG